MNSYCFNIMLNNDSIMLNNDSINLNMYEVCISENMQQNLSLFALHLEIGLKQLKYQISK